MGTLSGAFLGVTEASHFDPRASSAPPNKKYSLHFQYLISSAVKTDFLVIYP